MICFAPRITLETKLNISDICASFLIDAKQLVSEFQNKVFLVTLAVLVYSFNNQTINLWNSSNTTDNAVLQCLCLSFLVPAPLNLLVFFPDIDECNAANNSCHENAWCNNTQGSFSCSCKPGYEGDGYNCTGKILWVFSNPFKAISLSLRGD